MFFTYQEQAVLMPIMWSIGNASPITSGLLSYGVLWIKTDGFSPWKWFMGSSVNILPEETRSYLHFLVITGGITVIFGGIVFLLFPDSPVHASFLTYEERAKAILRIKENHSGTEQKTFKRYQYVDLFCGGLWRLILTNEGSSRQFKTLRHGSSSCMPGLKKWLMA